MKTDDFATVVMVLVGTVIVSVFGWFMFKMVTSETTQTYSWVVEREKRSGEDVQSDFDTLAAHGFRPTYDDDLEKSGHYVYFERWMKPSQAEPLLPEIAAKLKVSRRVK